MSRAYAFENALIRTVDADALSDGRAYDGVRSRRVLAFLIDYTVVAALVVLAAIVVFFAGIVTFGLGWAIYAVLVPLVALSYVGWTMSSDRQATWGMRATGIRLVREDGHRVDFVLAVVHAVMFWAFNAVLTPFILLATLFLNRKKTLHDLLLGTVVVRDDRV